MSEYVSIALRRELAALANGLCEYCLMPDAISQSPHEADHIVPLQHLGKTEIKNLALACFECNRHKGPNIGSYDAESGELVRLFHPRRDLWAVHFALVDGAIRPKTAIGRVTIRVLAINREMQVEKRRMAAELGLIVL